MRIVFGRMRAVEGREINEENMCRVRVTDSDKKRESVDFVSSDRNKKEVCVVTTGDV